MKFATQVVGNGALVASRIVSAGPCRLASIVGVNNGAAAYAQVFNRAAVPAEGQVPMFAFPIDAGRAFAFALPHTVDMDACTVVISSTLDTKTIAAGTPATIQGILAV